MDKPDGMPLGRKRAESDRVPAGAGDETARRRVLPLAPDPSHLPTSIQNPSSPLKNRGLLILNDAGGPATRRVSGKERNGVFDNPQENKASMQKRRPAGEPQSNPQLRTQTHQ